MRARLVFQFNGQKCPISLFTSKAYYYESSLKRISILTIGTIQISHHRMSYSNFGEVADGGCAPVAFVQALQHQVNEQDIHAIIHSQKNMLARFEKTNEMLVNCNHLLSARQAGATKELKKHIALLVDLKKDLEAVFRRIRFLKMKLSQPYSEAFKAVPSAVLNEEEEELEEALEAPRTETNITANASSSGSRGSTPSSPSTSDTG